MGEIRKANSPSNVSNNHTVELHDYANSCCAECQPAKLLVLPICTALKLEWFIQPQPGAKHKCHYV